MRIEELQTEWVTHGDIGYKIKRCCLDKFLLGLRDDFNFIADHLEKCDQWQEIKD